MGSRHPFAALVIITVVLAIVFVLLHVGLVEWLT